VLFFYGGEQMIFLITFMFMLVVIAIMSVGVMFKRQAIKGSCGGGKSAAECVCVEKCDKRKKLEAELLLNQNSPTT
jgi:hypothetical protein